jgi:hypothetical protein
MTLISRVEEPAAPIPATAEGEQHRPNASVLPTVTYWSLFLFYLPLGFSGLMMMLDLPVVNGVLNRFPNPDVSVAALRVAFSMALVYEASHIAMIDVSTALSTDARTFAMLRRFYIIMAIVLLAGASIVAFSPLYDWLVRDVMNISERVAEAARPAVWAFLLWPLPIGWRRLYQGALIRHGHPKVVGAGAIVRMGSLIVSLLFFAWLGTTVFTIEPAAIAVLAMLVSVTAEAVAVHGWTGRVLRQMPQETPGKPLPTYGDLWRFFFPLSGTAVMSTLTQPVLTAGIASAAVLWASPGGSTVSVASYAIAWSLGFLMFGPALSMTQASITWSNSPDPEVRRKGPRLLIGIGAALAFLVAIASYTPIAELIFRGLLDTPPATTALAVDVARWLVPMPLLHATSFMLRGKLIAAGRPKAVRLAQGIDLLALILVIQLATNTSLVSLFAGAPAAPLAAVAYNTMILVDIGVLLLALRWGKGRRAGG